MPVVNRKDTSEYDVYVGRPSPFGNPFVLGKHGDRAEVVRKYRRWLWESCKQDEQFRAEVAALHGKTLACWCAPDECHADVLLKAAEYYSSLDENDG